MWLCLNSKILTWDVLYVKGFYGLNICILCKSNEENVQHLFGPCPFFMNILKALSSHYDFSVSWDGETLNDNLHLWYTKENILISLPFFVLWES